MMVKKVRKLNSIKYWLAGSVSIVIGGFAAFVLDDVVYKSILLSTIIMIFFIGPFSDSFYK